MDLHFIKTFVFEHETSAKKVQLDYRRFNKSVIFNCLALKLVKNQFKENRVWQQKTLSKLLLWVASMLGSKTTQGERGRHFLEKKTQLVGKTKAEQWPQRLMKSLVMKNQIIWLMGICHLWLEAHVDNGGKGLDTWGLLGGSLCVDTLCSAPHCAHISSHISLWSWHNLKPTAGLQLASLDLF